MKFSLKSTAASGARRGVLSGLERLPDLKLETPGLLLYTQGGTVPHLTPDVLMLFDPKPEGILLSLPTIAGLFSRMKETPLNINQFIGLPNFISIATLVDPGRPRLEGFHRKDIVSVQSRGGKVEYTAESYMDFMDALKPDIFMALCDGDTKKDSSAKRVEKSMARSEVMTTRCIEILKDSKDLKETGVLLGSKDLKETGVLVGSKDLKETGVLVGLEGGLDVKNRGRYAESISKLLSDADVTGVVIDGLGQMGEEVAERTIEDCEECIVASLKNCTLDGFRLLPGAWHPSLIFRLIELGVDVFDSSYPCMVTDRGAALLFPINHDEPPSKRGKPPNFEISLKSKENAELFEPVSESCKCHCCLNHTKAYIHHLLNVNEMLATVLLNIHNQQQYLQLFAVIRHSIETDTFHELKESFR